MSVNIVDKEYMFSNELKMSAEYLGRSGIIPYFLLVDPTKLKGPLAKALLEDTPLSSTEFENIREAAENFELSKGIPENVKVTAIYRLIFQGHVAPQEKSSETHLPSGTEKKSS